MFVGGNNQVVLEEDRAHAGLVDGVDAEVSFVTSQKAEFQKWVI